MRLMAADGCTKTQTDQVVRVVVPRGFVVANIALLKPVLPLLLLLPQFHVDVSPACMDLVSRMLIPNPSDRIGVADILKHPWYLRNLSPELRSINRRMGSLVANNAQTEDEIQNVIQVAQEIDPLLLAGFQSMGFP